MVFLRTMLFVAGIAVLLVYAYFSFGAIFLGMRYLLDWGGTVQVVVLIVALVFRLEILLLPFVFYGAWKGWHWHWGLALLFTVPGIIPMLLVGMTSSAAVLYGRLRGPS